MDSKSTARKTTRGVKAEIPDMSEDTTSRERSKTTLDLTGYPSSATEVHTDGHEVFDSE